MNSTDYYQGSYSGDEWFLQPYNLSHPKVIALAYYKGSEYAVYLNPTDKRGYRSIVRLIKNQDMQSTLNRPYTSDEQEGLLKIGGLVERVYQKNVPIVQIFKAGNNSHGFDSKNRTVTIGKPNEASFLHLHIVGIGDPEQAYIGDVKLDGPLPGVGFDMRAKSTQPGNEKKVPWKEGDMKKVASALKSELKSEFENSGLEIAFE